MLGILDAGLIAHVGVTTPDGPLVLPMAYGRDEERLYLHGAAGPPAAIADLAGHSPDEWATPAGG